MPETDADRVADDMQTLHTRITRLIAECRALRDGIPSEGMPWTFDDECDGFHVAEQLELFTHGG